MWRSFVGGFPFRFWRALAVSAALAFVAPHATHAASATDAAAQEPQVKVLSPQDAARYEKIFALQEKAAFAAADREIAELENMVLMGHVLYQRYVHPTYRSRYDELKRWLLVYADHPGAARIYTLALKRKPKGAAAPNRPEPRVWRQAAGEELDELAPRRETGATRKIFARVRALVRDERPSQALNYLEQPDIKRALGQSGVDEALRYIANSYFAEGVDDKAYALAADVATRNAREVPMANWTAGLAAWRLGKRDLAARHFEALANASAVPSRHARGGRFLGRARLSRDQRARARDAAARDRGRPRRAASTACSPRASSGGRSSSIGACRTSTRRAMRGSSQFPPSSAPSRSSKPGNATSPRKSSSAPMAARRQASIRPCSRSPTSSPCRRGVASRRRSARHV